MCMRRVLCDKTDTFLGEKMKRENMESSVFIELLCNEIMRDGFMHISVQEALILYVKLLGCENQIIDKFYCVLNNTSKDTLSLQIYQD